MKRRGLSMVMALTLATFFAACGGKESAGDVSRGMRLFEERAYDEARAYYEASLVETPGDAEATFYLGRIAIAEERHDDALDLLGRTVELAPDSSNYYYWLGIAYANKVNATQDFMAKGQLAPKMKDAVARAVELDPENLAAREFLAQYLFNAPPMVGGSVEGGKEQIEEIKRRDPRRGHLFAARVYLARKDTVGARAEIDAAVAIAPDDPDVHFQLGRFSQDTEDYPAAFAAFERALELEPGHKGALYQLGRTAVFAGTEFERGIECLRQYLETETEPGEPTRAHARWRLGMIYAKQGKTDLARSEYEKALELDPDNENFRKALDELE